MQEKLVYQNPGVFEFDADILTREKQRHGCRVVLSKSYFFPQGGGQPADRGTLNGIPVTDVREENGQIVHTLSGIITAGPVHAWIDRAHRRDYQQQHTGQHIISAALWKTGCYRTISVHMGESITTIDIDIPHISEQHLIETEDRANEIIRRNLPVRAIRTDGEHAGGYDLRKPATVDDNIRLIDIQGEDCVGCCGLHLERTGDVGLVICTGTEKIRGNCRLNWKIGARAYSDYRIKTGLFNRLKNLLGTDESSFATRIEKLLADQTESRGKAGALENRLAALICADLFYRSQADRTGGWRVITHLFTNEDNGLIKKIGKELLDREDSVFCLINRQEQTLNWTIGCPERLSFPFRKMADESLKLIAGKGGGRSPLWQGIGRNPDGADRFFEEFRLFCEPIFKN